MKLGEFDLADLHGRVVLPVAALNFVLPAPLVLQDLHFGAAQVLDDLAGHFGFGLRAAENLLFVGADGDDLIEGHLAADFAFQALDVDGFARRDAVLLSPTANYSVHAASN